MMAFQMPAFVVSAGNVWLMRSEAAAPRWAAGDKRPGRLQPHLGPRQPGGLPHLRGPHQRRQRVVKGSVHGPPTPHPHPQHVADLHPLLRQEPVYSLSSDSKRLRLSRERLQPAVRYLVDVKAQLCPDKVYFGPWSEWSPTVEIGPTAAAGIAPPSLATGNQRPRARNRHAINF